LKDIYEHLRSYRLVRKNKIGNHLGTFSEAKISNFVESYLEVARKRPIAFRTKAGATDIYPDSRDTIPLGIIKQLSIYAERIYIHDPLLDLASDWQNLDLIMPLLMKYRSHDERVAQYRERLSATIRLLLELQPLVEAGIIHLAPTELVYPGRKTGAMYADDFYGPQKDLLGPRGSLATLPPKLRSYCQRNLAVWPAKVVNGELVVQESEPLEPRNKIAIGFPNEPGIHTYLLFDIEPAPGASDKNMAVHMNLDLESDGHVDPNTFLNWVEGSKYKVISGIVSRLQQDLYIAALARARFITSIQSSRDLAELNLETEGKGIDPVTALLQFELPYFDKVTFSAIAKTRQNEAAFEVFRVAMDKAFSEIDALPQSQKYQDQVNELYRDLLIAPLAKIEREMQILKRSLFIDATILAGSLVATFITQGNSLVTAATILAVTEALKMYKQDKTEEDKIKQLPSFFYWELVRGKS